MLIGYLFLLTRGDTLELLAEKFDFSPPREDERTQEEREALQQKGAIIGMCFAFVAYGSIHFPSTIMTRPHALFWRMILSIFCLYAMFMTYLCMLPRDQARKALLVLDSQLNKPMEERSYGEYCDLSIENLLDNIIDVHFPAHLLGWWGKMIIMRDWYVAWVCSIGFEICELTFRHWLPNFYECWWDHLFLDLFGCNLLGIILGYYTLKYFSASKINWVYDPDSERRV